jgi:xanthine/uracil permease
MSFKTTRVYVPALPPVMVILPFALLPRVIGLGENPYDVTAKAVVVVVVVTGVMTASLELSFGWLHTILPPYSM